MKAVQVRFVISELSGDEMEDLRNNNTIISKMILTNDDFALFKYKSGDRIEVENGDGYREWCCISDLESVHDQERVIIIFTLTRDCESAKSISQR
jgi:hypothetical protein